MKLILALAFIIFLVGLVIRGKSWFSGGVGSQTIDTSIIQRFSLALKSVFGTLFSSKVINALTTFLTDIVLQKRLFQKSIGRWTAHMLIFTGFLLLLVTHGLGEGVSNALFSDYYATLQPYLSLRNVFALMVLVGLGIAIYRRVSDKPKRVQSYTSDWLAIGFVGAIIITGILLESSKISSYSYYQGMVEEYGDVSDEQEALALETYWASEHGLISENVTKPYNQELVEEGRAVSENSCIECHSPTSGAFVSFSLAKVIGPLVSKGDKFLYVVHLLTCFGFLAWLPFSKMFHIVSVPVSLLINGVRGFKQPVEASEASLNRQMIGLSACTHCGSCSELCSSLMFYESFQNDFILPSEKVQLLKKVAEGETIPTDTKEHLQKGLYICTSCDRCSTICPSGINLRELFITARYSLLAEGKPETALLSHFSFPLALAQNFVDDHLKALKKVEEQFKKLFQKLSDLSKLTISRPGGLDNTSFQSCYTCQRCTNICPVVRLYDDPQETLGMLPHQIIFSLGVGKTELAAGSQMIWSCSTCYLCQEHCPNKVELTDIFYSLKNSAIKKIDTGGDK
ncbi:MAG: 4Fe-4S dicluster domain-containing protein [Desulfobulbaceae bacterium]|nr:MAG: 4Fe-4S dicluster domain-containing protein [Desulfobulbaceae bacterium]